MYLVSFVVGFLAGVGLAQLRAALAVALVAWAAVFAYFAATEESILEELAWGAPPLIMTLGAAWLGSWIRSRFRPSN